MRFSCSFRRWVGTKPTGETALGSDVAPTWAVPGPSDRVLVFRAPSPQGQPAKSVVLALRARDATGVDMAGSLDITLYAREEGSMSYQLLAAGVTLVGGALKYVPVPSPLDSGGLDVVVVAADPGAAAAGQYLVAAGFSSSTGA